MVIETSVDHISQVADCFLILTFDFLNMLIRQCCILNKYTSNDEGTWIHVVYQPMKESSVQNANKLIHCLVSMVQDETD